MYTCGALFLDYLFQVGGSNIFIPPLLWKELLTLD